MENNVLQVIALAEKLKYEMRHSWLSNGRQESVAEHTWRMSLMAILVQPYLDKEVNMEKLLKMVIIHDLVEAEAGDIPAFDTMNSQELQLKKQENEQQAMLNIKHTLEGPLGEELYHLWMEFEEKETYEAKVANALDKLEVKIQHNEADIRTWLPIEHKMTFQVAKHTNFDSFLSKLQKIIEREGEKKLIAAGIDVEACKQ
ncbi:MULTISPECIES: HD domain-containing protein [Bacillus cereus group]|uniref:HD domain-containing protein n=1 Tax=Bacillus cereus group TaxID=86661 RepID=UPI0008643BBC|nr:MULTISPECIES: HD domain-containing protein [Bacillus cereus group]AWC28279.1 HD domain-containing protein [Bacillus cytotoxicus]AWC40336.1 HD domain-containing protein [Bacillus cytotoxicus]AWC48267.1 HD domain-containing protein [Bacillus cytotoxicus]AWC52346.1 HD domain-containing protein [Bacillus cytotoxicus]AWC56480.1 HD domain-containing protein [Bacillus cytotoxicus]